MKPLTTLILCAMLLTGCLPILIHSAVESSAMEKQAYSAYLDTLRQTNTQRELAGLPPEPSLTRDAWRVTVTGRTNSPVYSPNDPRRR
jgi:hypothetical protein